MRTIRRGFTLVELLVVVSIIVVGTALIVPAFGRIIESVNYAGAVNTITGALGNARALAIRNGRHTGVAFLFDVETERCSVQVVELDSLLGGSLSRFGGANAATYAFVYRPATNQVPVELPRGTAVYGLSLAIEERDAQIDGRTAHWFAGHVQDAGLSTERPLWVFPHDDPRMFTDNDPPRARFVGVDPWEVLAGRENAISDRQAEIAVRHAQSFIVQFAPNGSIVTSPSGGGASTRNVYLEFADLPIALSEINDPDAEPYDDPGAFDPENTDGVAPSDVTPNREVVLRSATQLAVVDLSRLSDDVGVARPWYVRPRSSALPQPAWLDDLGYFELDRDGALHRRVSDWIDANAEVISFNRYTGKVIRRGDS